MIAFHRWLLLIVLMLSGASSALAEGKRYALLVGVKRYDHANLSVLDFTENDATEMAKVLREANYTVILLTDTEGKANADLVPTKANIEKQLKTMLAKRDRDDLILIGLAGHGLQFNDDADAYFCPKDAKPFAEEKKSLVSLEHIYKELQACNASAKVLLADCCRTDPQQGRGRNLENDLLDRVPPRGVYAFFSCSKDQKAFEHNSLKHGVFFYHVLEGLRGKADAEDDQIDFLSLAVYVNKRVPKTVATVIGGGAKQTPNLKIPDASGQLFLINRADQTLLREWRRIEEVARIRGVHEEIKKLAPEHVSAWKKAAENGSAIGQYLYARCLADGSGVDRDYNKAFEYYQKAANKRIGLALNEYGNCFFFGRGVNKDEFFAVEQYRKAADLGITWSMNNLGRCYTNGTGVDRDLIKAFEWYSKSAEAGNANGMQSLGVIYKEGRGTNKDEGKAVEWLAKSAERGDPIGMYHLGTHYEEGSGVTKDLGKAIELYKKAATGGFAPARDALKRLGVSP
ncbi:MAG: caspase family protein [Planctomycetes bacterium]|nr:caspase family protein [Planctomycetota bacterium]